MSSLIAAALILASCATPSQPERAETSAPLVERPAATESHRAELLQDLDSIARAPVESGRAAGLSVAVVRGTDTLLLEGYGQAELGLGVPMPVHAIHEIASITKQFTAAATLKLAEEGKLDLDDELTRYLPEYPTRGHRVTLRRLLNHTSGIHDYTAMPAFWTELARQALPRDTVVTLFAAELFDFAPGEMMAYSSSGYFLLGLTIEQASGLSYADYIEQEIFAPLGMANSHYCSHREIIEDRAHGYAVDSTGAFVRAEYHDHTWPYAAGSLCSTTGDLVTWMRALHGGRVLGKEAYREMITPEMLPHGHRPRYAKGLDVMRDAAGHPMIGHGGTITGFLSDARYYPEDDLYVVVLMNTNGSSQPQAVADALAERTLGPGAEVAELAYQGDLRGLMGDYTGSVQGKPFVLRIERDGEGLVARIGESGDPRPLVYLGKDTFVSESWRLSFEQDSHGLRALHLDASGAHLVLIRQVESR